MIAPYLGRPRVHDLQVQVGLGLLGLYRPTFVDWYQFGRLIFSFSCTIPVDIDKLNIIVRCFTGGYPGGVLSTKVVIGMCRKHG